MTGMAVVTGANGFIGRNLVAHLIGAGWKVLAVGDLASGIPEVVEPGVTGYRPPVGDIAGFADAIAVLARGRKRLEAMGTCGSSPLTGRSHGARLASLPATPAPRSPGGDAA